jgi:hypothetical protein
MINYLENPYPWRSNYNTEEFYDIDSKRYRHISKSTCLTEAYILLFPNQPLTFNIDILDPTLIESSLYHHYIVFKQGGNFSLKIQGKYADQWKKLKQEVAMAIKNPKAVAKKPIKVKAVQTEKKSRGPSEHVQFIINLIIQQKLTDEEIFSAAHKAFPGIALVGGDAHLSYFRCKINGGKIKIGGEAYKGPKLIGIKVKKPEAVKAPAKTPAKTPVKTETVKTSAKIPAKV